MKDTHAVDSPPASGLAHYLRDLVYGALDGVVTTMAVIAGAAGASLEPRIGVILGMANLVADGLSMGASNYLGLKSELQQTGRSVVAEAPWRHGLATALAFVIVGAVPLLSFVLAPALKVGHIGAAAALSVLALAAAGALRARFVRRPVWRATAETLLVGVFAAGAAYGVGAAVRTFV